MSALANAFKRAAGVPEVDIKNNIPTPYYGRKVIARDVMEKIKKPEPVQKPDPTYLEMHNNHGYKDFGYFGDGRFHVVCASCHACKMENRGGGTVCEKCNDDALAQMRADYEAGNW